MSGLVGLGGLCILAGVCLLVAAPLAFVRAFRIVAASPIAAFDGPTDASRIASFPLALEAPGRYELWVEITRSLRLLPFPLFDVVVSGQGATLVPFRAARRLGEVCLGLTVNGVGTTRQRIGTFEAPQATTLTLAVTVLRAATPGARLVVRRPHLFAMARMIVTGALCLAAAGALIALAAMQLTRAPL